MEKDLTLNERQKEDLWRPKRQIDNRNYNEEKACYVTPHDTQASTSASNAKRRADSIATSAAASASSSSMGGSSVRIAPDMSSVYPSMYPGVFPDYTPPRYPNKPDKSIDDYFKYARDQSQEGRHREVMSKIEKILKDIDDIKKTISMYLSKEEPDNKEDRIEELEYIIRKLKGEAL